MPVIRLSCVLSPPSHPPSFLYHISIPCAPLLISLSSVFFPLIYVSLPLPSSSLFCSLLSHVCISSSLLLISLFCSLCLLYIYIPSPPLCISHHITLNPLPLFSLSLQLPRDQITSVKVLGAGQFGTVYLANLSNDFSGFEDDDEEDRQVAVKLLRPASSDADVKEFRYECEVMCDLVHPNVVKLLGVCFEQRPWLAVLEMMNYGDLRSVMRTCVQKKIGVTLLEKLVLMEQALAGMVYVAERGYVHMDIAARNMLLHTNNLVKIADFGIAHKVDPETKTFRLRGHLRLAVRWMAPETLGGTPILFSEKTDVYAFAVFMWEIFENGVLPFHTLKSRAVKDAVREGLILAKPDTCPQELFDMMLVAWDKDPASRWTFKKLHEAVRNYMLQEEQASEPARDIGKTLNDSLTQTFRRLSVKASMVRRQSQKVCVCGWERERGGEREKQNKCRWVGEGGDVARDEERKWRCLREGGREGNSSIWHVNRTFSNSSSISHFRSSSIAVSYVLCRWARMQRARPRQDRVAKSPVTAPAWQPCAKVRSSMFGLARCLS